MKRNVLKAAILRKQDTEEAEVKAILARIRASNDPPPTVTWTPEREENSD